MEGSSIYFVAFISFLFWYYCIRGGLLTIAPALTFGDGGGYSPVEHDKCKVYKIEEGEMKGQFGVKARKAIKGLADTNRPDSGEIIIK